jgi:hypothetical protein
MLCRNCYWYGWHEPKASDISLINPGAPSLVLFLSPTIFSLFKMVSMVVTHREALVGLWQQQQLLLQQVCSSGAMPITALDA